MMWRCGDGEGMGDDVEVGKGVGRKWMENLLMCSCTVYNPHLPPLTHTHFIPPLPPSFQSYLRESGMNYLFPRVELYLQEPEQELDKIVSPIMDGRSRWHLQYEVHYCVVFCKCQPHTWWVEMGPPSSHISLLHTHTPPPIPTPPSSTLISLLTPTHLLLPAYTSPSSILSTLSLSTYPRHKQGTSPT